MVGMQAAQSSVSSLERGRGRCSYLVSPMSLTNHIQKSIPTMSLSFPFPFLFFSLEPGFNLLTDPKYLESRSFSTLSDTLPMPKCTGFLVDLARCSHDSYPGNTEIPVLSKLID